MPSVQIYCPCDYFGDVWYYSPLTKIITKGKEYSINWSRGGYSFCTYQIEAERFIARFSQHRDDEILRRIGRQEVDEEHDWQEDTQTAEAETLRSRLEVVGAGFSGIVRMKRFWHYLH